MAWAVAVGAVAAIFSPRGAVITCGPVSHHIEAWTVLKVERLYFRPLIGPRSSQALHSKGKNYFLYWAQFVCTEGTESRLV